MRPSAYPLIDAAVASAIVLERVTVLGHEELPISDCIGRVLAGDVVAAADLPSFGASAVDGYALRATDGGTTLPVVGESAAGRPFVGKLAPGEAIRILTGAVVPFPADCVVMVEDVTESGDTVTVPGDLRPRSNLHVPGADLARGETAVRNGTLLGAAEIGLAAATGRARLEVFRRPRVALLSTGDELVEVGSTPGLGQIVDSNRWALLAALREAGAQVDVLGIGPDLPGPLRELVVSALAGADVLVTSGGVSVGTHDLIKPLLESLGQVHVGRVKLRPGKPFTFATLAEGRVAFGLPGFPVSSLVTFEVFVRPALRRMQGFASLQRPVMPVRLGYDARATGDRTEYQRVTLRRDGAWFTAESTGSQSSSRLMSLAGAHALVRIPPGDVAITAGSIVDAMVLALP